MYIQKDLFRQKTAKAEVNVHNALSSPHPESGKQGKCARSGKSLPAITAHNCFAQIETPGVFGIAQRRGERGFFARQ
jgi:hypothetical protein